MKNKIHYMKAFSILETVVGLIVSAVVLGITFVLFEILTERMSDFKQQNQFTSDLNRFRYSLTKDLFESQACTYTDTSLTTLGIENTITLYRFKSNYILREKEIFKDTFAITIHTVTCDTLKNKKGNQVFQRFQFFILYNEIKFPFTFFKKLNTNELLTQSNLHEF